MLQGLLVESHSYSEFLGIIEKFLSQWVLDLSHSYFEESYFEEFLISLISLSGIFRLRKSSIYIVIYILNRFVINYQIVNDYKIKHDAYIIESKIPRELE